jgi:hypothetical protein
METSPTAHKVVFSFVAAILMLVTVLALSQQQAEATTGFVARSAYGLPSVSVRSKPSSFASAVYTLPNGASINVLCMVKGANNYNWLQLTDKNFISQVNSSVPVGSTVIPLCTQIKLYADRTVIKGSAAGVYIIQSGKILSIPNVETLTTCLGGWQKVQVISDSELNLALQTYPNGGTASCPVSYPSGTTLLAASGSTVFVVANGAIWGVSTSETLIACLGGWNLVRHISDAEMAWANASYPYMGTFVCPPVAYAENTLLQGSGPGVYLVHGGKFLGIPDPNVLQCYGGWPAVHHVVDAEILLLTITYAYGGTAGCAYSLPNGSKLSAPNGTVFEVLNGHSFGMPNPETLITCYGGWSDVRAATQAEIDTMLATYPYMGAAGCALPTIDARQQHAIDWAKSQLGSTYWNGYCELMVEQEYGTSGRFGSALIHANFEIAHGNMHTGDTNVPAGALAYFGAASVNGGYGHVMISIGGGQFITNGYTYNGHTYGATITTLGSVGAGPYIGWALPDSNWPGR